MSMTAAELIKFHQLLR